MKTIEAYESVDGTLHLTEKAATDRDDDCIGEAIDLLLTGAITACMGNVTRSDQYRMALYLFSHQDELARNVSILNKYLN